MVKTTAVSITADKATVDALHQLARDRKTTVGKLVENAVMSTHGEALAPLISFFRQREYDSIQLSTEVNNA
jgi:predicted DNA-binding ribbon-helix-helix protein